VDAGTGTCDDDAFIGLEANGRLFLDLLLLVFGVGFGGFDDFHHHFDGVAGAKFGDAALRKNGVHLLALELLDKVHLFDSISFFDDAEDRRSVDEDPGRSCKLRRAPV
jgi:hypothetical protein